MYRIVLDKIYKVNTNTIQTIYKINTNTKQNRHCKYVDIVGEGNQRSMENIVAGALMASRYIFVMDCKSESVQEGWNNLLDFL